MSADQLLGLVFMVMLLLPVVVGVGVQIHRTRLLRRMKESRRAAWGLSRE
jgi:hypothetical protein